MDGKAHTQGRTHKSRGFMGNHRKPCPVCPPVLVTNSSPQGKAMEVQGAALSPPPPLSHPPVPGSTYLSYFHPGGFGLNPNRDSTWLLCKPLLLLTQTARCQPGTSATLWVLYKMDIGYGYFTEAMTRWMASTMKLQSPGGRGSAPGRKDIHA